MTGLIDPQGRPLSFEAPKRREDFVTPPIVAGSFGQWAGRDFIHTQLPGGGVLQFDLSRLTLADFRAMRHHYQLSASLNVLGFIIHQADWHIECDKAAIADMITEDLEENWTMLMRGLSQAFWAGYSPMAVNYQNARDGYVRIKNFKDLIPEECEVKWRKEDGWVPDGKTPYKIYHYDGFTQNGHLIPPENTLWYPMLMENGDFYGRKLLKPAFPAWFFSNLIHLFANRYFERFGEPLPVGRAPFEDRVDVGGGKYVSGKQAMEAIIGNIRSRSAVVMPSDRSGGTTGADNYDYDIEYLESQMRGADFERYLGRLDEEMSLALFTPVLLFRTADVGSYNLGQEHARIFAQSVNSIVGDMQLYLQAYVVDRLRVINFGQSSPRAKIVFRKQGKADIETYKLLMSELVRLGYAAPDLRELGEIVGLSFEKIDMMTAPDDPAPTGDGSTKSGSNAKTKTKPTVKARAAAIPESALATIESACVRVERELDHGRKPLIGYRNRLMQDFEGMGFPYLAQHVDTVYARLSPWLASIAGDIPPAEVAAGLKKLLIEEFEELL